MAFSLNRAQIIGNVTRAPEVRVAGSQKVATFGVATNLVWTDQSGQKKERAEFHNIVAWRKLAEICEQYLRKGTKVYIEGRLQTRDWEGEDGVKRYKTEIVADNMIMLDRKGDSSGSGAYGAASTNREAGQAASAPEPVNESADMEANREQRSVKNAQKIAGTKAESQKPQEEEVSIDDLPF